MGDGLTDVRQDESLQKQNIKISKLEEQFKEEPSSELAEEIIREFDNLLQMKRGYWKYVNILKVDAKKKEYITYLKKNQ